MIASRTLETFRQLKAVNRLRLIFSKIDWSQKAYYRPECVNQLRIQSLKTVDLTKPDLKLANLRFSGVKMQIEYYDTHLFEENITYKQSSMPTIVLLPGSQHELSDYDYLIDSFASKNYRVVALRFPGN
jgi:hypothetical protein